MSSNFGDFQIDVYFDAVNGVTSRYPFDAEAVQRKAAETLPDWVYRYVSAASGDGRTQRENVDAYKRYGIIPRMMVSPPERDLSIDLFGQHFDSPIFMPPIGLVGLCSPDFQGDIAAARASTDAVIALARGATAVGVGRVYALSLSYGGAESLTHFLKAFLAELDLCLAICGFKDIAELKAAGVELVTDVKNARKQA
jgi:isopentenyl diphosphate isomerase/L-lactate dehydrogenase-like FMN-dependent dehydrogenase